MQQTSLIIFGLRGPGLAPSVIRFCTRSPHHHVGIIDPHTNIAYESVTKTGVTKSRDYVAHPGFSIDLFRVWVTEDQKRVVLDFLEKQLGKRYDWSAVVQVLNYERDWTEDDEWFCSELVAAAFLAAGIYLIRKPAGRVTPGDCVYSALVEPITTI